MKNDGRKTANTLSMARKRGTATSRLASARPVLGLSLGQMHVNVFHQHGAFVHQHTDGQGQPAQRHDVDRLADGPKRHDCNQQGERV